MRRWQAAACGATAAHTAARSAATAFRRTCRSAAPATWWKVRRFRALSAVLKNSRSHVSRMHACILASALLQRQMLPVAHLRGFCCLCRRLCRAKPLGVPQGAALTAGALLCVEIASAHTMVPGASGAGLVDTASMHPSTSSGVDDACQRS